MFLTSKGVSKRWHKMWYFPYTIFRAFGEINKMSENLKKAFLFSVSFL